MNHICAEKGLCCAQCDDVCDDACQWYEGDVDCDEECIEDSGGTDVIFVVDNPDEAEGGTCLKCGKPYVKTIGESNVSMTGYCYSCGFNP